MIDFKTQNSPVAQAIRALIEEVHQHRLVDLAVLSTIDGLPLETTAVKSSQFAAAVGFLMANAQQTCANLSLTETCYEVVVRQENGRLLVCRSFDVENGRLILAVLLKQDTAHNQLLTQTVEQVQAIISHYQQDMYTSKEVM